MNTIHTTIGLHYCLELAATYEYTATIYIDFNTSNIFQKKTNKRHSSAHYITELGETAYRLMSKNTKQSTDRPSKKNDYTSCVKEKPQFR